MNMSSQGHRTAFALNIAILVLVVFSVGWMLSGINAGVLSTGRLEAFKYFTIDSNVLMGICALIAAIEHRKVLDGRMKELSKPCLVLQLVGATGVTLTMLITVFFLAPTAAATYGILPLFAYSNFFLHLVNPILSIVTFVHFEKTRRIRAVHTLTGIAPMLIYAVFYVSITLLHTVNGVIEPGYDWYGFFFAGIRSVVVVVPVIVLIAYAISHVLWRLNRRKARESTDSHALHLRED
ncbi:MAG: hypothetical protein ACOYIP_08285 [Coriobacteriales bacterium]